MTMSAVAELSSKRDALLVEHAELSRRAVDADEEWCGPDDEDPKTVSILKDRFDKAEAAEMFSNCALDDLNRAILAEPPADAVDFVLKARTVRLLSANNDHDIALFEKEILTFADQVAEWMGGEKLTPRVSAAS